jgi:SAM-dependent methyltransferase
MERDEWDRKYAGDDLLWTSEPNRFLVEQTSDLAPGRVLDLACGEGRNAVWLAGRGWRATGVDFSGVALGKARRLASQRGVDVEWVEADVRAWRPPTRFDLVAVLYLQLPAAERRAVIRTAADALDAAPGSRLLVIGHDLENLTQGVGGPQDPSVLFTVDDVLADIEGGGLVPERAFQARRPVEVDGGPRDALDVVVRAVRGVG